MRISIDDAGPRLDELVDRAEAGEEVVLTRDGLDIVKLVAPGETPRPSDELRPPK